MSLNVYLTAWRLVGVFEWNITHNLVPMAVAAELYLPLWRPNELGIEKAGDLIPHLEKGLEILKTKPEETKEYNPANGWGCYEDLVLFVERYLEHCKSNPDACINAYG